MSDLMQAKFKPGDAVVFYYENRLRSGKVHSECSLGNHLNVAEYWINVTNETNRITRRLGDLAHLPNNPDAE